jgi:hypothetical protein
MELAKTVQPVQDGRIHIEKINGLFLQSSPAEYKTGLDLALAKGSLERIRSATSGEPRIRSFSRSKTSGRGRLRHFDSS